MSLIVVIDDRPKKRRQLLNLAASVDADVGVEGFASPRAAIESAVLSLPDLVVLGRTLPTLNSVRAVRRFRKVPECEDIPIILLTDAEDLRARFKALEAGASEVFVDPPDADEFALRARNLLVSYARMKDYRTRTGLLEHSLATKERRFRRDLKSTRANLRGIVDTVPALVSVADRDGSFVFINQFMAAFAGINPEEAIGTPIEDILGPDHGEREKTTNAEIFGGAGALAGFEEEITDSSGMVRTFLSSKSALRDDKNRIINVITVSQDITFRKWVESELREAKNAAESASRVKTEFLANVSHELRTPLNAIIGFAEGVSESLLGTPDLDRYREYTGHISESAHHLKAIIDDILDISSIESGGLDVSDIEADPVEIVRDTVKALQNVAENADVTLRVEPRASLPPLRTDPGRLQQILSKLVSNAIKFSPVDGEVWIELTEDAEGNVLISVKDTGAGIATEDLPQATDRFEQLGGDPMSNPIGGMGLGLPLSISLAELLGARVDIDSVEGVGTRITLKFPPDKLVRGGRKAG